MATPYAQSTDCVKENRNPTRAEVRGEIPLTGRFNQDRWAAFLGISVRTFREWVDEYQIPKKTPGRDLWVDAEQLWEHLPE